MLIIAAIICNALGIWYDGVAILFIVFFNASLGTYMTVSAAGALEALANMSAPKAHVIRGGVEKDVEAVTLVTGDVVVLRTGDKVPADVRVFESQELGASEKQLTGEPYALIKQIYPDDIDVEFPLSMCFASTNIEGGVGKGIVVRIGMQTEVARSRSS
jgi:Ca2+-transporting ATPase